MRLVGVAVRCVLFLRHLVCWFRSAESALQTLEQLSEAGLPLAKLQLANKLLTADREEAKQKGFQLLKQAAEVCLDRDAQYRLGQYYEEQQAAAAAGAGAAGGAGEAKQRGQPDKRWLAYQAYLRAVSQHHEEAITAA